MPPKPITLSITPFLYSRLAIPSARVGRAARTPTVAAVNRKKVLRLILFSLKVLSLIYGYAMSLMVFSIDTVLKIHLANFFISIGFIKTKPFG
jgi:hypothetical protein